MFYNNISPIIFQNPYDASPHRGLNDKSRNEKRLDQFESKNRICSTIRFGYSVFGQCLFASDKEPPLDDILSILIFRQRWSELNSNSRIDVKLLEASIIYKVNFFVTQEKKILEKNDKISENYGLRVVDRETMRAYLENNY